MKIPLELQMISYPQSYRFYDPVPLIIDKFISEISDKFKENKVEKMSPNSITRLMSKKGNS